jgi:hypothetical protein
MGEWKDRQGWPGNMGAFDKGNGKIWLRIVEKKAMEQHIKRRVELVKQ